MDDKKKLDKFTKDHIQLEVKYHDLITNEKDTSKRQEIYSKAYQEYYELFSKHHVHKKTFGYKPGLSHVYRKFIEKKIVVDIGCGYGISTFDFSRYAKKVYGLEIADHLISGARNTAKSKGYTNVEFIKLEANKLPFPDNSVDTIYSNDLVEHLHEDDLELHFSEVYRTLKNGGVYICLTPNRIFGPHDITVKLFNKGSSPVGLHIHEFTYDELLKFFIKHNFRDLRTPLINEYILKNLWFMPFISYFVLPPKYKTILERIFLFRIRIIGFLFGIFSVSIIGKK